MPTTEVYGSSYRTILVEVPHLKLYIFRGLVILIDVLLSSINSGSKFRNQRLLQTNSRFVHYNNKQMSQNCFETSGKQAIASE
jgi:hypothetical protein